MKLELNRTQAQAVAAACQVAACEWNKGVRHSQEWAKIVNEISVTIVATILGEHP